MSRPPISRSLRVSLGFLVIAALVLPFADLEIIASDPWPEFLLFFEGLLHPHFLPGTELAMALAYTIGIAILALLVANVVGFLLSLAFTSRFVRMACAALRSVHELFWALIFLQFFGPSPLTGLLAIAVPYAAIIAKVYAEIAEETPSPSVNTLPAGTSRWSRYVFGRLPDLLPHFKTYSLYRLECGLRSSVILGFVGLPTLGYYLESAFKQGYYSEVWGLLILFYVVIGTMRYWARPITVPVLCFIGLAVLPWGGFPINLANIATIFTEDIIPAPLRHANLPLGDALTALAAWGRELLTAQIVPGVIATLQVTMLALAATGLLALVLYPVVSKPLTSKVGRTLGHAGLVILRSTPEYLLAFMLLQLWGPSMLPAVVALAIHNGAIIGHLIGRQTDALRLRIDLPRRKLDRYFYEITPRVFPQMLAFLFYRWEVIMRETAVFGMLGIATLGFYIDSAFSELRLDRALVLIAVTALLNLAIDSASRRVRDAVRGNSAGEQSLPR